MPFGNKNSGFTLIELLVVIAVIGMISSIILVSVNSARAQARDAQRIGNVDAMTQSVEMFLLANNYMPLASSTSIGMMDLAPQWQPLGNAINIAKMPRGTAPYYYMYMATYNIPEVWATQVSPGQCLYLPKYSAAVYVRLESNKFLADSLGIAPDSPYYIKGIGDTAIISC